MKNGKINNKVIKKLQLIEFLALPSKKKKKNNC